jgi:hypothetical protein
VESGLQKAIKVTFTGDFKGDFKGDYKNQVVFIGHKEAIICFCHIKV